MVFDNDWSVATGYPVYCIFQRLCILGRYGGIEIVLLYIICVINDDNVVVLGARVRCTRQCMTTMLRTTTR